MRKTVLASCVIVALLVAGSAVAGDWEKVGKKNLVFGNTEKAMTIDAKGEAASVAFKISGDWVRFTEVTLNFSDGSKQTLEDPEKVRPGMTSEPIAIDGGPKTLSSIDFMYKAASSANQGRATVVFLGQ